jgi:uncharacterized protein YjgD (DUF1641 family)
LAKPISRIKYKQLTEEEKKSESLNGLTDHLTENEEALQQTLAILAELHNSGILESAESLLKAKAKVTEIALEQVSRKEVTNMINNAMEAAGALSEIDPDQTKQLLSSVSKGLEEAKENKDQKVSLFTLMKALNDPDINRAVGFGLNFLKGLGKGLK